MKRDWKRFYLLLTLNGGYSWAVRGDQIASLTELIVPISGGGARTRVLLVNGHTAEVKEEHQEVLQRWSDAVSMLEGDSLDE